MPPLVMAAMCRDFVLIEIPDEELAFKLKGLLMPPPAQQWFSGVKRGIYDDVTKWKHFSRYWAFVWGIHRLPVNSPHKGQWRGALIFSLICAWINGWLSSREADDLRRDGAQHSNNVSLLAVNKTNELARRFYVIE